MNDDTASSREHGTAFSQEALRRLYDAHADTRVKTVKDLASRIERTLSSLISRPTIKGRIKTFRSFFKKYIRILKTGASVPPRAPCVTDLMGIRVVCPFIEDLAHAEELIKRDFEVIEVERKSHYTFKEFGYESIHLLIRIPKDITAKRGSTGDDVAEIQIRTILQDAWAEVEHELVYKAEFTPFDDPMKRKLAAVNATLSLADTIFQEIRTYQRQLNGQLGKRRESFFQKIEESIDAMLFTDEQPKKTAEEKSPAVFSSGSSIDDLLLNALYAHNKNRFDDASALYSRILELKPADSIRSLIYKHRGMANFARSQYLDAIDDFSRAFDLDKKSYKAAYYRGVVRSVLKEYAGAIDDFSLSLEINPYQSFCLFRRGQAYFHTGDYPQALSDCEASIALEPDNEAALKFRELLKSKLKM